MIPRNFLFRFTAVWHISLQLVSYLMWIYEWNEDVVTSSFHSYVAVHIIFICVIPFTGTMNSINWPAPKVWVFIAQLVEHCSVNAEAMGSNPVEAPKTLNFFGLNWDCLNRKHDCDDHTFIQKYLCLPLLFKFCHAKGIKQHLRKARLLFSANQKIE